MSAVAVFSLAVLLGWSHWACFQLGRADRRITRLVSDFDRDRRVCDEAEVQP